MVDEKYKELINKVIQKTSEGKSNWLSTGQEDQYVLHLSKGSIVIDKYDRRMSRQVNRMVGGQVDFLNTYEITISNDDGNVVDSFSVSEDEKPEAWSLLKELYDCARRSYLKIDETLDGMLEEVKTKEQIGQTRGSRSAVAGRGGGQQQRGQQEEQTFEPDDELPF